MKGDPRELGFATRAIHAGQAPDPRTGAVAVPIYQTSTYVHDALGEHKGYEYARVQNPTREALEENVAALEMGHSGHAFASGMSAIAALLTLVKTGEHVVVSRNVYGGTYPLLHPDPGALRSALQLGRRDLARGRSRQRWRSHPDGVPRDADQSDDGDLRHRRRGRDRPCTGCAAGGRQHLPLARICNSRSRTARTWWCTPPRST